MTLDPARPLHVLEVGLRWPPEAPFIRRKLDGLVAAGVRVTVASPVERGAAAPSISGVRLVRLRSSRERKVAGALWIARDLLVLAARRPREALRVVRATRPRRALRNVLPLVLAGADVLHFEWEQEAIGYLDVFEALGRPVVVSCRANDLYTHPRTRPEVAARYPELFAKVAAAHCVSAAIRDEAVTHGLDPAKGQVIRSGVDARRFAPGSHDRSDLFRVLSIGQLKWIKNLEDGIRAVALLLERGVPVSYAIAGGEPRPDGRNPSDRPRLLYLIHELGVGDHVHLLGKLDHEGAAARLGAADALLLPSLSEGIANCVLEAMACGLPVVVTDCGGMTEAVTDGVEGLVCPRRDPEALADALERLWRDPALARRLGESGRARVLADFTPERERAETMRLYEEVCGRRPAVAPARAVVLHRAAHR